MAYVRLKEVRWIILSLLMAVVIGLFGNSAVYAAGVLIVDDAMIAEQSDSIEGGISTFSDSEIEQELTFHKVQDSVTYSLKILNTDSKDYTINDILVENDNDYINYELDDDYDGEVIDASGELDIILRAEYTNRLENLTQRDQDSSVKLIIKYSVPEDEIVNPGTWDSFKSILVIAFLFCAGLAVALIFNKRRKIFGSAILVVAMMVSIPVVVNASDTFEEIIINSTYHLNDRVIVSIFDGTNTSEQIIDYGGSISAPDDPSKEGYTFDSWISNDEPFDFGASINSDLTLEATFTPNTDTLYKVLHKKMKVNGEDYDDPEIEEKRGTTGANVTPGVKTYEHFVSPQTQTKTITGDGKMEVEYLYAREQYELTLTNAEYIDSNFESKKYYYGTTITLKAKEREGFVFKKWSNDVTSDEISFEMESDVEIGPIYEEIIHTAFEFNGACRFNGPNMNISGDGCEQYSNNTYIDTGVGLFSEDDYRKDFLISFNIDELNPSNLVYRATLFNATLEDESRQWPGIVLRRDNNTNNFVLGSNVVKDGVKLSNKKIYIPMAGVTQIALIRKNMNFCYQINNGAPIFVNNFNNHNEFFELTSWVGASVEDGVPIRHFTGVLSNIKIQIGADVDNTLTCEEN
ncbi:MAG: InlB B-repeat-containing protein [Candidatus Saccharibacteria bacterium]|nr:InlB B-repeat-containing protein [Candidatus Saccharibacteria bacterium]